VTWPFCGKFTGQFLLTAFLFCQCWFNAFVTFAQEALGHKSKAVHRAYARRALMKIPSLEDYERQQSQCFH